MSHTTYADFCYYTTHMIHTSTPLFLLSRDSLKKNLIETILLHKMCFQVPVLVFLYFVTGSQTIFHMLHMLHDEAPTWLPNFRLLPVLLHSFYFFTTCRPSFTSRDHPSIHPFSFTYPGRGRSPAEKPRLPSPFSSGSFG